MPKNFKLYYQRALTGVFGAAIALTLANCGSTVTENTTQETTTTEPIESTDTVEQTNETETTTSQQEKDSAAETAISVMIEGAGKLKDSATEATNSEAFQEELARSLQNFKDLSNFIFNGGEINGVTFDELSAEGQEYARNALNSLDDVLEYLVPNYKERFRDWFTDTAASGLDALSELRDKGIELWDEIQSKRNTK